MKKTLLWKIRGLNLLSFSLKKFIFFEAFIRPFFGQSFIKTVRGPLKACMHFVCNCIKFKEYVLNHFQNQITADVVQPLCEKLYSKMFGKDSLVLYGAI